MNSVLKDNGKDESCLSVSDKVITVSLGSLRKRNVIYNYTSSLIHLLLQQRNPPPFSLILSLSPSLPDKFDSNVTQWNNSLLSRDYFSKALYLFPRNKRKGEETRKGKKDSFSRVCRDFNNASLKKKKRRKHSLFTLSSINFSRPLSFIPYSFFLFSFNVVPIFPPRSFDSSFLDTSRVIVGILIKKLTLITATTAGALRGKGEKRKEASRRKIQRMYF